MTPAASPAPRPAPRPIVDATAGGIGVVCGLHREHHVLRQGAARAPNPVHRLHILCHGPGPAPAATAAAELIARGCRGLVSMGTAAGLDLTLPPGTLGLPRVIVPPDPAAPPLAVATPWWERLVAAARRAGLTIATGPMLGCDAPLLTPDDKASARLARGAGAADMESHAIARVAQVAGLPFVVLRAIADPADQAIAPWVLAGMGADGRTRLAPLLLALAQDPRRLGPLVALARNAGAAERTLALAATLLAQEAGPG